MTKSGRYVQLVDITLAGGQIPPPFHYVHPPGVGHSGHSGGGARPPPFHYVHPQMADIVLCPPAGGRQPPEPSPPAPNTMSTPKMMDITFMSTLYFFWENTPQKDFPGALRAPRIPFVFPLYSLKEM